MYGRGNSVNDGIPTRYYNSYIPNLLTCLSLFQRSKILVEQTEGQANYRGRLYEYFHGFKNQPHGLQYLMFADSIHTMYPLLISYHTPSDVLDVHPQAIGDCKGLNVRDVLT